MKIEYFHASKYGNGARVAEEFKRVMADQGVEVHVHHIREVKASEIRPADLYLFSSPGRIGKPLWSVRWFLRGVKLPSGTRYAILATQAAAQPGKNGKMPTDEELAKWQRIIPTMNKILHEKGLVNVAESVILVTGLKGPLEIGWETKVANFADRLLV